MRALDWSQDRSGRSSVAAGAADVGQHLPRLRVPDRALVGTASSAFFTTTSTSRCSARPSIPRRSASRARGLGGDLGRHRADAGAGHGARARPTRSRDLLLHIDRGYPEETYFSFSYSPIHDEDGTRRRRVLPGHRDHRQGHRRAPAADAARPRGADARAPSSEDAAYDGGRRRWPPTPHDVPFALIYRVDDDERAAARDRRRRHRAGHAGVARARQPRAAPSDRGRSREVAALGPHRDADRSRSALRRAADAARGRSRRTARSSCRCCCPARIGRAASSSPR